VWSLGARHGPGVVWRRTRGRRRLCRVFLARHRGHPRSKRNRSKSQWAPVGSDFAWFFRGYPCLSAAVRGCVESGRWRGSMSRWPPSRECRGILRRGPPVTRPFWFAPQRLLFLDLGVSARIPPRPALRRSIIGATAVHCGGRQNRRSGPSTEPKTPQMRCRPRYLLLHYVWSPGYRLGNWVNMQRGNFARGTLDDDRQTRLQDLPGWSWQTRPREV
jgi:hypothetical protein